jgi:hypothetical protein
MDWQATRKQEYRRRDNGMSPALQHRPYLITPNPRFQRPLPLVVIVYPMTFQFSSDQPFVST